MTPQSSEHLNLSSNHPSNSFLPFVSQLVWTHTLKGNIDPFDFVRPPAFQYNTIVCGGTCSCHQMNSFEHEVFHDHFHETYGSTSTVRSVGLVDTLAVPHVTCEPGRDHSCLHLPSCIHHLVHWFGGWHCGRPPDYTYLHVFSFGLFWPRHGVCRLRDTPFFPTSPLDMCGTVVCDSVTWTLSPAEPLPLRCNWHPFACEMMKSKINYIAALRTSVVSRVYCNAPSPEVDGRFLDALVVTARKSKITSMGIGCGRNVEHTSDWSCPCCRPLPLLISMHCCDINFTSCIFWGIPLQSEVATGHLFGTHQTCNVICSRVFVALSFKGSVLGTVAPVSDHLFSSKGSVSGSTLPAYRDNIPVANGEIQSWTCYKTSHCLESFQLSDCDVSDILYHIVQGSHFAFAAHDGDFLFVGGFSIDGSHTMHIRAVWFKWPESDIQYIHPRVRSKPQCILQRFLMTNPT